MELLNPEVDIEVNRGSRASAGKVGIGRAVIRIQNDTAQENLYTITLDCKTPYWQDAWYTMTPVVPAGTSAPRDKKLNNGRSYQVAVTRGEFRDVVVDFRVPEQSASRAGKYEFTVNVTPEVTGGAQRDQALRKRSFKGVAVIRPFFKYKADVLPPKKFVKLLRRRAFYELKITNEGNDWLYCDVRAPMPNDKEVVTVPGFLANLEEPPRHTRVAIPPPEPGQASCRTIPIKAVTKQKALRGMHVESKVQVQVSRVDAPSVPRLPEMNAEESMGLSRPVMVESDVTTAQRPYSYEPPILTYKPAIPATWGQLVRGVGAGLRSYVMAVVGLAIIVQGFLYFASRYMKDSTKISVSSSTLPAPGPLLLNKAEKGSYLRYAVKLVGMGAEGKEVETDLLTAEYGTAYSATAKVGEEKWYLRISDTDYYLFVNRNTGQMFGTTGVKLIPAFAPAFLLWPSSGSFAKTADGSRYASVIFGRGVANDVAPAAKGQARYGTLENGNRWVAIPFASNTGKDFPIPTLPNGDAIKNLKQLSVTSTGKTDEKGRASYLVKYEIPATVEPVGGEIKLMCDDNPVVVYSSEGKPTIDKCDKTAITSGETVIVNGSNLGQVKKAELIVDGLPIRAASVRVINAKKVELVFVKNDVVGELPAVLEIEGAQPTLNGLTFQGGSQPPPPTPIFDRNYKRLVNYYLSYNNGSTLPDEPYFEEDGANTDCMIAVFYAFENKEDQLLEFIENTFSDVGNNVLKDPAVDRMTYAPTREGLSNDQKSLIWFALALINGQAQRKELFAKQLSEAVMQAKKVGLPADFIMPLEKEVGREIGSRRKLLVEKLGDQKRRLDPKSKLLKQ